MPWLHTVGKSPYERDALASCLRIVREGSAVLLLEDGVYAAVRGGAWEGPLVEAASRLRFFALGPDLAARGIDRGRVIDGVEIIDYHGFVDLAVACEQVTAWL